MTDTTIAERVAAQVPGFELPEVPRRFALFEYDEDDTLDLCMWGIQTATEAFGFYPNSNSTWHSSSAERIESTLSRIGDIELIWLDEPAQ